MKQTNSKKISIIIPVYNEEENLEWHHEKINSFFESINQTFQIIYVNDGSTDSSLLVIKKIYAKNPKTVKYITLSRNFGKEAATSAGLSVADGDAVVIMDGDGQHPIELVTRFIELWKEGNEVVVGIRSGNTGEGFIKKYGSVLFYKTLQFIGGKSSVPGSTDFRLIDRKVVDEFNKLTERNRVTRNLIDWLGYKRTEVPFEAAERHAGTATYSFRKLFKLAIDGIVSHSTRPLKLIAVLGLLVSTISGLGGILITFQSYILGDPLNLSISGSALLAIFVTFLIGIVLVCQGLLALYIESVYYESQNRPLFVISETSE